MRTRSSMYPLQICSVLGTPLSTPTLIFNTACITYLSLLSSTLSSLAYGCGGFLFFWLLHGQSLANFPPGHSCNIYCFVESICALAIPLLRLSYLLLVLSSADQFSLTSQQSPLGITHNSWFKPYLQCWHLCCYSLP